MTRNGKIARLPLPLREEINRRLEQNLPGRQILDWLNSLPEARAVLDSLFNGRPISKQNLSEWRLGGFVEWQTHRNFLQDFRDSAEDAPAFEEAAPLMADHASRLLSARIAIVLSKWNGDMEDPVIARLKNLSGLVRNVVSLRRGDHTSARLKLQEDAFGTSFQNGDAPDAAASSSAHSPHKPHPSHEFDSPYPGPPADAPAAQTPPSNPVKPCQTTHFDPAGLIDLPESDPDSETASFLEFLDSLQEFLLPTPDLSNSSSIAPSETIPIPPSRSPRAA